MLSIHSREFFPDAADPEYAPYRTSTQGNLLTQQTDAVLPRHVLARQGMTLDQIGHPRHAAVKAEVHHASYSPVDEFRKLASSLA
jgi:hypothetical protein